MFKALATPALIWLNFKLGAGKFGNTSFKIIEEPAKSRLASAPPRPALPVSFRVGAAQ